MVVHEDHSDPIVHVDVTYHGGSAREEIGKAVLPTLNTMFQEVIMVMSSIVNCNWSRWYTGMVLTQPRPYQLLRKLFPATNWKKCCGWKLTAWAFCWMLLPSKFEVQRAAVKNEKRPELRYNQPYGLAAGEVSAQSVSLWPSPSWLTIGYVEELNRVKSERPETFFLRWYGPLSATVGGWCKTCWCSETGCEMLATFHAVGPRVTPVKLQTGNTE